MLHRISEKKNYLAERIISDKVMKRSQLHGLCRALCLEVEEEKRLQIYLNRTGPHNIVVALAGWSYEEM
jgi:hypothetical protein